jgi:hypothetical protein
VPDRKSRFSKKSAKNSSIIFENLSGPEKKTRYFLRCQQLLTLMPENLKFQAHLPCG